MAKRSRSKRKRRSSCPWTGSKNPFRPPKWPSTRTATKSKWRCSSARVNTHNLKFFFLLQNDTGAYTFRFVRCSGTSFEIDPSPRLKKKIQIATSRLPRLPDREHGVHVSAIVFRVVWDRPRPRRHDDAGAARLWGDQHGHHAGVLHGQLPTVEFCRLAPHSTVPNRTPTAAPCDNGTTGVFNDDPVSTNLLAVLLWYFGDQQYTTGHRGRGQVGRPRPKEPCYDFQGRVCHSFHPPTRGRVDRCERFILQGHGEFVRVGRLLDPLRDLERWVDGVAVLLGEQNRQLRPKNDEDVKKQHFFFVANDFFSWE